MKPWHAPLVAMGVLFLIGNVGAVIEALYGRVPGGFLTLYTFGVGWAAAWWVLVDCRRQRIEVSIDHGWFVLYTWPLALPYHLLRTRGWRGLLVLALMLGMWLAAWGLALVVYFSIV